MNNLPVTKMMLYKRIHILFIIQIVLGMAISIINANKEYGQVLTGMDK